MPDPLLRIITDLGDSAVTGSLSLVTALALVMIKERRAALAITLAFILTATAMILIKILFYSGCAVTLSTMHSPSGHSALAVATYGTLAAIIAAALSAPWRAVPYLCAVLLVLSITISRVSLGAHSPAEVVTGLLIGLSVTLPVIFLCLKDHTVQSKVLYGVPLALIFLILSNGVHLPAEKVIAYVGGYLHHQAHLCASV